MAWTLWNKPECTAAKLHLHFDVLKAVPCDAAVTPAACSEPGQLKDHLKRPMRLVIVQAVDRDGQANPLWLITDRLDLDADLVALAYRYRWSVELFFRWLKCILGARHLISQSRNGVTLQMYAALIVSLLIVLPNPMPESVGALDPPERSDASRARPYFADWIAFDYNGGRPHRPDARRCPIMSSVPERRM